MMCNGYILVWNPNHPNSYDNGCIYEHIMVAEQKLGRFLNNHEHVHHIDGCKTNNNPDNLMVFDSNSSHIAFHEGHVPIKLDNGTFTCDLTNAVNYCVDCGKPIDAKSKRCVKCYAVHRRTVTRPSKDELALLITTKSFLEIGRMYGVSDNAVRKWCKSEGLPYKRLKREISSTAEQRVYTP